MKKSVFPLFMIACSIIFSTPGASCVSPNQVVPSERTTTDRNTGSGNEDQTKDVRQDSRYDDPQSAYDDGAYDVAKMMLDRAIAADPENADAYLLRGLTLMKLGQPELAVADLEKALELGLRKAAPIQPKLADAFYELGLAYALREQFSLAISNYDKAVEINPAMAVQVNPKLSEAYYGLGLSYAQTGQLDAAIATYGKAIAISPRMDEFYASRANAYSEKGQFDLAIKDYQKVVEINPSKSIEINRTIGNLRQRLPVLPK